MTPKNEPVLKRVLAKGGIMRYCYLVLVFAILACPAFAEVMKDYDTAGEISDLVHYDSSFYDYGLSNEKNFSGQSLFFNITNSDFNYNYSYHSQLRTSNEVNDIHLRVYTYDERSGQSASAYRGVLYNHDPVNGTGYFFAVNNNVGQNDYRIRIFRFDNLTLNYDKIGESSLKSNDKANQWMYFDYKHYANGTIRLEYYLPNGSLQQKVDAFDTTYKSGYFGYRLNSHTSLTTNKFWFDNLTIYSGAESVVVNLISPTTDIRSNQQPQINFTATSQNVSTLNCSLYIDGAVNLTNSSVSNNTPTLFTPTVSEGLHDWYLNCTDGITPTTTTELTYDYDATEPFIQSANPSSFNTTVFTNYSMQLSGNVTDTGSLYRVRRTVYYPNTSVFYQNDSGNITAGNVTEYAWDEAFNTTAMPNGLYSMLIEAADSHTDKHFKSARKIEKDNNEKRLRYELEHGTVSVQLIGGNVLGQFETIDTTKLDDRYTFDIQFKNKVNPNSRMVFRVAAECPMTYLPQSVYPAHFVFCDHYWLDFAGIDGEYVVSKVDSRTYDVEIVTTNPQDKFVFRSLGGLNEGNLSISFEINNCLPNWVCGGYGACNESDLAPCLNATDTNSCGLSYTGNATEDFTAQSCNYCSYNLELVSIGYCNESLRSDLYEDENYGVCCNVTQLVSDCYFGLNDSQGYINTSCSGNYLSSYATDDLPEVVIDGLFAFLYGFVALAGVIGLVMVFRWARRKL